MIEFFWIVQFILGELLIEAQHGVKFSQPSSREITYCDLLFELTELDMKDSNLLSIL